MQLDSRLWRWDCDPACSFHRPVGGSGCPWCAYTHFWACWAWNWSPGELLIAPSHPASWQQEMRVGQCCFTESYPVAHLRGRFGLLKTRASPREHVLIYQWLSAKRGFHSLPASAVRGSVSEWDGSWITECSSWNILSTDSCLCHTPIKQSTC